MPDACQRLNHFHVSFIRRVHLQVLQNQEEWLKRLQLTTPRVHVREPLLALRRCVLELAKDSITTLVGGGDDVSHTQKFDEAIGSCWLVTAQIARKEKMLQASYSALLRAAEYHPPNLAIEEAQLLWDQGQQHEALIKLREDLALVPETERKQRTYGEAAMVAVEWMRETARFSSETVVREYKEITTNHPTYVCLRVHVGDCACLQ